MLHITTQFLKDVLKSEPLKQYAQLEGRFDELVYLFKGQYPSSKLGNDSLTMALAALEFVLNAEAYFISIGSTRGKRVFDKRKAEFINHFDYPAILQKISKGARMLFLYRPGTYGSKKLSADGVIGKFHSIEHFSYDDNPHLDRTEYIGSNMVVVKLEISNNGIIELPVVELAHFGCWEGNWS